MRENKNTQISISKEKEEIITDPIDACFLIW